MELIKGKFNIIQGNALDVLKTLPDNYVQMCVTSPPYYGLRDYGTGKWVGGDPNCKHMKPISDSATVGTHARMRKLGITCAGGIYKSVCPDCGAIRVDEQIGLEETPEEYIQRLVEVFREFKRVLKEDGTLWVNIGDSYCGSGSRGTNYDDFNHQKWIQEGNKGSLDMSNIPKFNSQGQYKNKDLIGIPWMLAFALRNDGWYLRQDIIWAKNNCMPESVTDRCTKSHEYIFLLSKSPHYYFDNESIKEEATGYDGRKDTFMKGSVKYKNNKMMPYGKNNSLSENGHERWEFKNGIPMRNKRDVWNVSVNSYSGAHFATFPTKLIEPCILSGSKEGDIVLDMFNGSGTTGEVSLKYGRKYIGIELNQEYIDISMERLKPIASQKSIFNI